MEPEDLDFYNKNKAIIKMALNKGAMNILGVAKKIVAPDALSDVYMTNGALADVIHDYRDLTEEERQLIPEVCQSLIRQIPMIVWRIRRTEKLDATDRFNLRDSVVSDDDFAKLVTYREQLRIWPDIMQQNGTVVRLKSESHSIEHAVIDDTDGVWPTVPKFTSIKI